MIDKKVTMVLRVEEDLRDSFLSICHLNDTSGSREIRKFMREYIEKRRQGDLFQAERGTKSKRQK